MVTKHAHIQAVSRQNELFHNADRPTTLTTRAVEERVRKITGGPNLVRSLVQMDAPDHPKYRALTQGWFMPANLGKFEARVREIARATVQRMLDKAGLATSSRTSRSAIPCMSSWRSSACPKRTSRECSS